MFRRVYNRRHFRSCLDKDTGARRAEEKIQRCEAQTPIKPITCAHCGGQAYLMRRTLHPKIKGEIWTFECKDCSKQTEKSVLHQR
jgi:transcription elongation factor Elf1